jgi:hypothetical protein
VTRDHWPTVDQPNGRPAMLSGNVRPPEQGVRVPTDLFKIFRIVMN